MTKKWITSAQASRILTGNSGHEISDAYVRRLALSGKLRIKQIDGRTKLYHGGDVAAYVVTQRADRRTA